MRTELRGRVGFRLRGIGAQPGAKYRPLLQLPQVHRVLGLQKGLPVGLQAQQPGGRRGIRRQGDQIALPQQRQEQRIGMLLLARKPGRVFALDDLPVERHPGIVQ